MKVGPKSSLNRLFLRQALHLFVNECENVK